MLGWVDQQVEGFEYHVLAIGLASPSFSTVPARGRSTP